MAQSKVTQKDKKKEGYFFWSTKVKWTQWANRLERILATSRESCYPLTNLLQLYVYGTGKKPQLHEFHIRDSHLSNTAEHIRPMCILREAITNGLIIMFWN